MPETIKERLAKDEIVMAIGVGRILHHNILLQIGQAGGFHAVWFDQEHTGLTVSQLEVGCIAARAAGLDSFVRVAPTDYAIVTQSIEAGSSGVMAAQVYSAEQAEEIVKWAKFAPRGYRGLNATCYAGGFGTMPIADYCEQSNKDTFVAIQIETEQSVEECDAIAAIDGVDLLFVGPSDLSQNLGVTGDFFNEKCIDAIDKVSAACAKHNIHWGAVTPSPEHAAMVVEKGCKMISPSSDAKLVNVGLQAVKSTFSQYF